MKDALVFILATTACAPAPRAQPPAANRAEVSGTVRQCAMPDEHVPDVAINFDLFVATTSDLVHVFPGSLLPRSAPRAKTITEVHHPFSGELVAGPFDPPLVIQSYEPDGPWPTSHGTLQLSEASARRLPWLQCGGLHPDGFEALGDALGLPRPPPDALQKALGTIPERLRIPVYPPPESFGRVHEFPREFVEALATARDASALSIRWSKALRARRLEPTGAERAATPTEGEALPPDAEQLRAYFTMLTQDILSLAKDAASTRGNLYVHHWPD